MVVELVTVGTEILMGNIVNTNASYLSEQCVSLGLSVYHEITVGDNEERLTETIRTALSRADIVILTGGLGPTEDDLTKEVTAKVLGRKLIMDEKCKEKIKEYFQKAHNRSVTNNNWKQAEIIDGAQVLANDNGTAPGLYVETEDGKRVVLLPGPPDELIPMFEEQVKPRLAVLQPYKLYSRMVKICGLGESLVATKMGDVIADQTNPTIATYAKVGEVHLRVTARAESEEEGKKLLNPVMKKINARFGNAIYTTKEEVTLEDCVVHLLNKKGLTLALAESCTGGLLAGRIVNVSGASEVFGTGVVSYSNKTKHKVLGVKKQTLKEFGAVSEETAREMAKGIVKLSKAEIGVAVTGIAGPEGGTKKKPVGLVYIACSYKDKVTVEKYHFAGNRTKIRERSVVTALDLIRRRLSEEQEDKKE
ncbi:competence/damage-inducible protein A [Anaerolentibacter hominis]|uniref:competence/damage-inducible protein A n=1 Tax=Anaerolentibacter hominis TaxID=3079009 RepID=UPI0031B89613